MSSADEDVLDQNDGNESEALKRGRNDDMDVPKKKVKYIQKYKESYHFLAHLA
jgi:23S rRNA maturation mini-RNase III